MSFALLKDWLGDKGEAVPLELAEARAAVCVTCPENRAAGWWDKFKNRIAMTIRKQLEIKNGRGLRVSCENRLAMCRVCGCALPLKVHVPIAHVKTHLKTEELKRFPLHCWIPTEIETP